MTRKDARHLQAHLRASKHSEWALADRLKCAEAALLKVLEHIEATAADEAIVLEDKMIRPSKLHRR